MLISLRNLFLIVIKLPNNGVYRCVDDQGSIEKKDLPIVGSYLTMRCTKVSVKRRQ